MNICFFLSFFWILKWVCLCEIHKFGNSNWIVYLDPHFLSSCTASLFTMCLNRREGPIYLQCTAIFIVAPYLIDALNMLIFSVQAMTMTWINVTYAHILWVFHMGQVGNRQDNSTHTSFFFVIFLIKSFNFSFFCKLSTQKCRQWSHKLKVCWEEIDAGVIINLQKILTK